MLVHARAEEQRELRELAGDRFRSGVVFMNGSPRADAVVLRTDRFYDADSTPAPRPVAGIGRALAARPARACSPPTRS